MSGARLPWDGTGLPSLLAGLRFGSPQVLRCGPVGGRCAQRAFVGEPASTVMSIANHTPISFPVQRLHVPPAPYVPLLTASRCSLRSLPPLPCSPPPPLPPPQVRGPAGGNHGPHAQRVQHPAPRAVGLLRGAGLQLPPGAAGLAAHPPRLQRRRHGLGAIAQAQVGVRGRSGRAGCTTRSRRQGCGCLPHAPQPPTRLLKSAMAHRHSWAATVGPWHASVGPDSRRVGAAFLRQPWLLLLQPVGVCA